MAVALDVLSGPGGVGTNGHMFAGSIANGTTGATVASFQNIGASATFLTVMVSINDSVANIGTMSVHWDSAGTNQNMTAINSKDDPGGAISIWLFGLVNPTTGTKSIKITWSGGAAGDTYEILGASWTGTVTTSVAAATEGAATANSTTGNPSVTTAVSIPSGDMAFSGIVAGNALTIGTGTLNDVDGHSQNTLSARYSGAGSTISGTATQTSASWAAAIVGIKAGGTTAPFVQTDWPNPQLSDRGLENYRRGFEFRYRSLIPANNLWAQSWL